MSQIRDDHSWDDPRREVNLGLEDVENQGVEESNVSRVSSSEITKRSIGESVSKNCVRYK